jgi:hypothetical protein
MFLVAIFVEFRQRCWRWKGVEFLVMLRLG